MTASAPALVRHPHRISDEEVLRAKGLAKKGEQRLYDIVNGKPNDFSFNIQFDHGRIASVEFLIDPITSDLACHTLYSITGRYTPSDEDVQSDQVLEIAQLVYDTYIRVSSLILDPQYFERRAPCRLPLSPPLSLDLNPLPKQRIPPCTIDEGSRSHASAQSIPFSNGRKRLRANHCSEYPSSSHGHGNCVPAGSSTSATEHEDLRSSIPQIANNTIKKIKSGLLKREKEERKSSQVICIDQAVARCVSSLDDDKKFDKYLNEIERGLKQAIKLDKSEVNKRTWATWMFLCCLRLVRERRRGGRRHVPSQSARLFNLIINQLFISDGVAALEVYEALAEHCYKASDAARLSAKDIENVSHLVAEKLHGHIPRPLDTSLILFPGVWLSIIFPNIPYSELCNDIGLPNLAQVKFDPELSPDGPRLMMRVQISEIRVNWKGGRDELNQGDLEILKESPHNIFDSLTMTHPEIVPSSEDGSGDIAPLGFSHALWEDGEDGEIQISDLDDLLHMD